MKTSDIDKKLDIILNELAEKRELLNRIKELEQEIEYLRALLKTMQSNKFPKPFPMPTNIEEYIPKKPWDNKFWYTDKTDRIVE